MKRIIVTERAAPLPVTRLFSLRSEESGAVWVFFLLIVGGILAIAALVIDSGRQELAARQLEDAVDAAALAGARALNGGRDGWLNAKRAALTVLKSQMITGTGGLPDSLALIDATIDPLEDLPSLRGTQGRSEDGTWEVTIERGTFWGSATDSVAGSFHAREGAGELFNLPPYHFANAVRVNVKLNRLPLTFAKIFGAALSTSFERTSLGLMDRDIEECVAPIAIPACALLADTTPGAEGKYDYQAPYNPEMACEREIVATEAITEIAARLDGITRSDSFPRPPYEKGTSNLNLRAVPVQAVLGVPGTTAAQVGSASKDQILSIFRAGCVKAHLGQSFRPLDDGVASGFLSNQEDVDALLGQYLGDTGPLGPGQDPAASFSAVFGIGGTKKGNFPAVRSVLGGEREYRWPARSGDEAVMLLNTAQPDSWTNPMCHSASIEFPDDPERAKVRTVTAMVIAPSNDEGMKFCDLQALYAGTEQDAYPPASRTKPVIIGFKQVHLFDFNVRNLTDYEATCPGGPEDCACDIDGTADTDRTNDCHVTYFHPEVGKRFQGANPLGVKELSALTPVNQAKVSKYLIDLKSFVGCLQCVPCGTKNEAGCQARCPSCSAPPLPNFSFGGAGQQFADCFSPGAALSVNPADFCNLPSTVPYPVGKSPGGCSVSCVAGKCSANPVAGACAAYAATYQTELQSFISSYKQWQYSILDQDSLDYLGVNAPGNYNTYCAGDRLPRQALSDIVTRMTRAASSNPELKKRGTSRPGRHCLPKKVDNCFNSSESGLCWDSPRDRKPQFGCGGVRLRLNCEKDQVFPTIERLTELKPALALP